MQRLDLRLTAPLQHTPTKGCVTQNVSRRRSGIVSEIFSHPITGLVSRHANASNMLQYQMNAERSNSEPFKRTEVP